MGVSTHDGGHRMPFVLKGNYDKPAGAIGKLKAAKHEGITDVVVIFHFLSGIILVGPALCPHLLRCGDLLQ